MTIITSSPAPRLRDGVEKVVGMEGLTLLHDTASGTYHRVGALASTMIDLFDGTRTHSDIASAVNARGSWPTPVSAAQVEALSLGLGRLQLLVGGTPRAQRRTGLDRMMPRFLIFRGFARVLAPVVEILRPLYRPAPIALAVLLSLIGYAAGLSRIASEGLSSMAGASPQQLATVALLALCLQLLAIVLHESWHGIVCGLHGQPARGLGVALLFWVMPVAYVDRTDAYRLRRRSPRVAIALAGMVNDGWIMGATAVVAAVSEGTTHLVASTLAGYQLILLIANLNPLAPSDTVSAIEAATGEIDLRGRARTILLSALRRRSLPGYLAGFSGRRWTAYLIYGALSYLFAAWVVLYMGWSIYLTTMTMIQGAPS